MIRIMKNSDLTQCGSIYTKAFPMEYWGIDWTTENATEYLQDFFEQRRFVGFVYEENKEVLVYHFLINYTLWFIHGILKETTKRYTYYEQTEGITA